MVDAVNSHLLLFHENESRERNREGGRESGLEPTRSVRKMEIVVERIRLNEDRGFSSDGKKRLCLETRWRAVTCGMTQQ